MHKQKAISFTNDLKNLMWWIGILSFKVAILLTLLIGASASIIVLAETNLETATKLLPALTFVGSLIDAGIYLVIVALILLCIEVGIRFADYISKRNRRKLLKEIEETVAKKYAKKKVVKGRKSK